MHVYIISNNEYYIFGSSIFSTNVNSHFKILQALISTIIIALNEHYTVRSCSLSSVETSAIVNNYM